MDLGVILKGCLAGKTSCQRIFYEEFYAFAFRVAFRYVQNREHATLLVNEAFVEFFQNTPLIKAQTLLPSEINLKKALTRLIVPAAIKSLSGNPVAHPPSLATLPSNLIPFLDEKRTGNPDSHLMSFLGRLPVYHRVLFNMHVIDLFPLQEIATYLHTSVSNCVSGLSQARAFLNELMNEKEVHAQAASNLAK